MRPLFAALMGVLVLATSSSAKRTLPEPCSGGRFIVAGDPLLTDVALDGPDAIVIDTEAKTIAFDSGCPAATATLTTSFRGTRVKAAWKPCGDRDGLVRLSGRFEKTCTVLSGGLWGRKRSLKRRFEASRTACGDGIVDSASGESCEEQSGCPNSGTCTACQCLLGPNLRFDSLAPGVLPGFFPPYLVGGPFPIAYVIRNAGNVTATAGWAETIFLSTDATLDGADLPIVSRGYAVDLAPGETYSPTLVGSGDVTYPFALGVVTGVEPGNYFLIGHIDTENTVTESDEADNFAVAPIVLDAPAP